EASDMANESRKIIQDNQLSSLIEVIAAPSLQVKLPEKVDVIVTETFGSHPFEENSHEFVHDARQRFLKADGIVLPGAVSVFASPADFMSLHAEWMLFS